MIFILKMKLFLLCVLCLFCCTRCTEGRHPFERRLYSHDKFAADFDYGKELSDDLSNDFESPISRILFYRRRSAQGNRRLKKKKKKKNSGTNTAGGKEILDFAKRKAGEMEDYKKFLCTSIGTMPSSEFCWNKNGNQREVGGRCKAPNNCLLYEMPSFYPTNKVLQWSSKGSALSFKSLQKEVLNKWKLSNDLQDKIYGASFFQEAKMADMYVFFTSPHDHTANFKLEIATITADGDGGFTSLAFVRLENVGWMAQQYICQWASQSGVGSGTRHCSKRGFNEQEVDIVRSTLEYHAWKMIIQELSSAGSSKCKAEFNCFCYMQRNPNILKDIDGKNTCQNAMKHYLLEGKKRGLDGTCCAPGAKRETPRGAEVMLGECKMFSYDDGKVITRGLPEGTAWSVGMDRGRGATTAHCSGYFRCDGDLLYCPAKSCGSGEDTSGERDRTEYKTYECFKKCVPFWEEYGDRDRRRLGWSRYDDDYFSQRDVPGGGRDGVCRWAAHNALYYSSHWGGESKCRDCMDKCAGCKTECECSSTEHGAYEGTFK